MSSRQPPTKSPASKKTSNQRQPSGRDMGAALRSVYQHAVEESVPDEMLDLLGKLN